LVLTSRNYGLVGALGIDHLTLSSFSKNVNVLGPWLQVVNEWAGLGLPRFKCK
jgi:hypothetical protein